MIRVGIAGLGRMGVSHFAIANSHPSAKVVSICEPAAFVRKALERHAHVKCFKHYEDMVEKESLDAIFITTPTRYHYPMTRLAIENGLHVFVEKPFCLNPQEGQELVKLATEKGIVNQVGYHSRFLGTFREAKRLIGSRKSGDVYHVLGEVYGPVVLREAKKTWRTEPTKGGGCLYDYAAHIINLMQFLNGPIKYVSGSVLQNIYSKEVDDAVFSSIQFENGATGQIRANWSEDTYRKFTAQVTVFGKFGKIRVDAQELHVFFKQSPEKDSYCSGWNTRWLTDLSPGVGFYLRGEEYSLQVDYFLRAIKNGTRNNTNSFAAAHDTDKVISLIKADADGRTG